MHAILSLFLRFYTFLCRIKALTTKFNDRPQDSSRPFDKLRSGFVMADGAATLILEVNMRFINLTGSNSDIYLSFVK